MESLRSRTRNSLWVARGIALFSIVFGVSVSLGWSLDIDWMTRISPAEPQTRGSTAINFVLAGVSILLLSLEMKALQVIGSLGGLLLLGSCGLTIFEGYSEGDLNLAHTLWTSNPDSPGLTYPGPMAPAVGVIFSALGLALALCDFRLHKVYGGEIFSMLAMACSATTFIGNAAGVTELCTFAGCIRMPFIDSLLAVCLAAAILLERPQRGMIGFVMQETASGLMSRRAGLLILILPCLLWLRTLGEQSGLYEAPLGWALFGVLSIVALALIFGLNASLLARVDSDREESQKRLAELSQRITEVDTRRMRHVCLKCSREFDTEVTVCPDDGTELARLARKHWVGEMFADKYEIVDFLGQGGVSAVYKARHVYMNRLVAIKVIHANLSADASMIRRLQLEARTTSALDHPNILSVHDFGISDAGEPYIVMDYLEGRNLSQILDQEGVLDSQRLVSFVAQICEGLEVAHQNGILHRDLKPSNVMVVERDGKEIVKLVDFGLAKELNGTNAQLTASSEILGSPAYMSPEQCSGEALDARSDIYSLGCLIYECLSGVPPFANKNMFETLAAHLYARPPAIHEGFGVPEWFAAAVFKAMEKDPVARFQSASELKAALLDNVKVT